ncbi:hypothetical protein L3X38_015333 [Prunus dulcis]|uniref:Uncharacterized protein n=1 Tax=Prunus dulcis TaxID=3755 RepID=A0AAD4ZIW2_PRUDU|nr:hypothetical protein L3X38_015333 [Prunus dulcis]
MSPNMVVVSLSTVLISLSPILLNLTMGLVSHNMVLEEIPTEVIAESIELAKRQQEAQRTEPTSSELTLFDEVEVEHSASVPEPEVEENRTAGSLAVVTSPLKPPIVAIPIHSVLGSSTTTSFADPELVEFEAMDLDAHLDRLEKLGATPSKAKSRAMDEAVERVRIWQPTKLDLDKNKEAVDQLMKDLDLLHSENMTPWAILERNLHPLAPEHLKLADKTFVEVMTGVMIARYWKNA